MVIYTKEKAHKPELKTFPLNPIPSQSHGGDGGDGGDACESRYGYESESESHRILEADARRPRHLHDLRRSSLAGTDKRVFRIHRCRADHNRTMNPCIKLY